MDITESTLVKSAASDRKRQTPRLTGSIPGLNLQCGLVRVAIKPIKGAPPASRPLKVRKGHPGVRRGMMDEIREKNPPSRAIVRFSAGAGWRDVDFFSMFARAKPRTESIGASAAAGLMCKNSGWQKSFHPRRRQQRFHKGRRSPLISIEPV